MTGFRTHGPAPFRVAVLHGGPGAPGAVSLLADELGRSRGVIEPFQSADSIHGQIEELLETLEAHASPPVALVGSSWGAWLAYLFAARHPALVERLVLVGCPPFEDWYGRDVTAARLRRLPQAERAEAEALLRRLGDAGISEGKDADLARIGRLFAQADSVDPVTTDLGVSGARFEVHSRVWKEARRLRARGELTAIGRHIRCPVLAIHGDHDPHPADGVEGPLQPVVADFRFVLLRDCGHFPWIERRAKDDFFKLLRQELPPPTAS